jgi:hypothetical protein
LPTLIWCRAQQSDSKRLTLCFLPIFLILFVVLIQKQAPMNNPFEEIFKRLENIEKMIAPVMGAQPEERQDGKEPVLVKISVASGITGYSVNYLYHLASKGMIPCVKRGRTLRFDMEELKKWMQQQYVPTSNRLPDEKEKK